MRWVYPRGRGLAQGAALRAVHFRRRDLGLLSWEGKPGKEESLRWMCRVFKLIQKSSDKSYKIVDFHQQDTSYQVPALRFRKCHCHVEQGASSEIPRGTGVAASHKYDVHIRISSNNFVLSCRSLLTLNFSGISTMHAFANQRQIFHAHSGRSATSATVGTHLDSHRLWKSIGVLESNKRK